MIIAIQSTGVTLDLQADIKLNIEMTSPIFSNAGSMSLPISLPLSSHNRRALNFPDRLDIYDSGEDDIRAIKDIDVIVTQGSLQQLATMSISGCSESSVEVTLYFNESNIWSKIADMTLPQVMAGMHYGDIPPTDKDIEDYREKLYKDLKNDIHTYPIFKDLREDNLRQGDISYEEWEKMLSERAEWFKNRDFFMAPIYTEDGWLNKTGQMGRLIQTTGYLYITAFLRLDYILHKIFEKAGYSLTIDFDTFRKSENDNHFEDQWHSIVVLNNTMDALYPGCMYYSALVPEITCKEFLMAVQAQFGCAFVIQSDMSYKMIFTEGILTRKSVSIDAPQYVYQQTTFNSSPGTSITDNIEKSERGNMIFESLPDTPFNSDYISGAGGWDDYPKIHTIALNGVCQRTTTTITENDDTTKSKKCPLIFVRADFAIVYITNYDQLDRPGTSEGTYPAIRKPYIELLREPLHDTEDISLDIVPYYFSSYEENPLFVLLNKAYSTISENCDRITITSIMSISDLISFDFMQPLIIKGRFCWPVKVQYEMTNSSVQQVSLELISPRVVV